MSEIRFRRWTNLNFSKRFIKSTRPASNFKLVHFSILFDKTEIMLCVAAPQQFLPNRSYSSENNLNHLVRLFLANMQSFNMCLTSTLVILQYSITHSSDLFNNGCEPYISSEVLHIDGQSKKGASYYLIFLENTKLF